MMDDNTHWQPIEATTPVPYPYPYEHEIGIPPPPPTHKKPRRSLTPLILLVVLAFFLMSVAGLFYLAQIYTVNKEQPTPIVRFVPVTPTAKIPTTQTLQPTPPINPNYTADTIMDDFQTAGIQPAAITSRNSTIWSWSGNQFYVGVHAKSSVTWTDDNGCNGPCDPTNLGLWIYSSSAVAETAYQDVKNDEYTLSYSTPTGPTIAGSDTPEYVHGRCLLLGPADSMYIQVVDQYCI